ncbi:hypothetical protein X768_00500 [Mesorhizobium sp. LSJC265A00]|nr:hypothetical protein X768_00500 [Mesorhizobium sp. LSJC265A00]ESX87153.1 hypothetical protein X756_14020 [Mesorhizobium sp. LSHC412B00]ESY06799.1 hypothetical protein X753_12605 [Mesorhizobium sp. LNJC399B00]ESY20385.1 hypothetical protein X749_29090 [Mesorhizobium sp. LNJC391B00]ESZ10124.1 hypothetical protein X736_01760 [Mesorhizobium sp. L2C089B000]
MGTVRAALRSGYRDLRRRDLNIGQLCRERFWRSGSLGHYVQSSASQQFDAFVWFDRTSPVQPLTAEHASSRVIPDTFPLGT